MPMRARPTSNIRGTWNSVRVLDVAEQLVRIERVGCVLCHVRLSGLRRFMSRATRPTDTLHGKPRFYRKRGDIKHQQITNKRQMLSAMVARCRRAPGKLPAVAPCGRPSPPASRRAAYADAKQATQSLPTASRDTRQISGRHGDANGSSRAASAESRTAKAQQRSCQRCMRRARRWNARSCCPLFARPSTRASYRQALRQSLGELQSISTAICVDSSLIRSRHPNQMHHRCRCCPAQNQSA